MTSPDFLGTSEDGTPDGALNWHTLTEPEIRKKIAYSSIKPSVTVMAESISQRKSTFPNQVVIFRSVG